MPLAVQRDAALLHEGNIPERRLSERLIASVLVFCLCPLAVVQGDLDPPDIPQNVPGVVAHLRLETIIDIQKKEGKFPQFHRISGMLYELLCLR